MRARPFRTLTSILIVLVAGTISGLEGAYAQAPTVWAYRNLQFGTVMAGIPETVPINDAGRIGRMLILGTRNAEVLIVMTLPVNLTSGPNNLPISFGPTSGGYSNSSALGSMTPWDPNTPLITRLSNFFFGLKFIVLGGTVTPALSQPAGNYAAPAAITVSYTGN